jgi:NADH-quinone oxidoreductase subunit C
MSVTNVVADATPPADPPAEVAVDSTPSVIGVRKGMWGTGPGDVSGFGGLSSPVVRHQRASRPYGSWFDAVADRLEELVPGLPDEVNTDHDELTFFVPKALLLDVVRATRDDAQLRFETCPSVSGVHYPDETGAELHVVYNLSSMTHNRRVRLEVTCGQEDPVIDSVTSVYPHADWHERETWDMFGVIFAGHPGLTRILMPDDWQGHPQRKDYPLGGVPVEFKGAQVPPPDQRRSY